MQKRLEMASETVICLGVPFMAYISDRFTIADLYPKCLSGVYTKSKCTPSISKSVVTNTCLFSAE